MKIGRYEIKFGKTCWIQTRAPTRMWSFLLFWVFKEARPEDVDKKPQFPPGTGMGYEGRVYRYYKATKPLEPGERVTTPHD